MTGMMTSFSLPGLPSPFSLRMAFCILRTLAPCRAWRQLRQ